ncbi:hypothetical protein COCON_G00173830 [Conger conger]|uniref:BAR domain-containing protein n=1 Tax=Conger conger TaxID=82655 RepID=A0A9Q1HSL3_CONCO|nr:hypothetical protein COCON_G00173830 [Conger conger]
MPGIDKLPIEETLEDSPQTRSLLGVFEEDAAAISSYTQQLFQAMQRIYDAQNELSAATHLTSKLLKEYEKQRFPLGGDDEVMSSTLQQFAKVIDELSSCHAVLSTQLADAMMFPITQFKERDLKEILTLKEVFQIASDDHDMAINRYSRLSKRRDNEKVRCEVMEDVYTSRKKQHQTMMHYFTALNTLQYKKKIALLEPLLGYMQAQISFFKLGSENLTQQWEDFLSTIGTSVQNVRREMDGEVDVMQQTIQDLEQASDILYMPDPDPSKIPINRNLTRKAGYLNTRNKTGLVSSSWDRQYFFSQGGNLMSQARGDITSFDGKKVAILQAESRKDCEEWIATINNISKRIYLSENPEEIAARVNQSALEAVTPSPSFQQRHESLRPSTQGRPRAARSSSQSSMGCESPALSSLSLDSLVAPDTPIQFDIISPVSEEYASQAKSGGQGSRRTNPFGESGETPSEDSEGNRAECESARRRRKYKTRIFKSRRPLCELSEEECARGLGLPRAVVREVCAMVAADAEGGPTGSCALPVALKVTAALAFLTSGSFQDAVSLGAGVSQSAVSAAIHTVCGSLVRHADEHVAFPSSPRRRLRAQQDFRAACGLPRVLGAVDCTHVTCDANRLVTHVCARYPGSTRDARILANSALPAAFRGHAAADGCLVGDDAYP